MKKTLALLCLSTAAMFSAVGCSTPGYSAKERGQMIGRNMGVEWQMIQDDVDSALLLRPVSMLSRWHVR